jgi:hypothetical protein
MCLVASLVRHCLVAHEMVGASARCSNWIASNVGSLFAPLMFHGPRNTRSVVPA